MLSAARKSDLCRLFGGLLDVALAPEPSCTINISYVMRLLKYPRILTILDSSVPASCSLTDEGVPSGAWVLLDPCEGLVESTVTLETSLRFGDRLLASPEACNTSQHLVLDSSTGFMAKMYLM